MSKLEELANKLFNMKPDEKLIKTLKGEVMIPSKDIKK
ncbi:hypothetical protein BAOM_2932 [Peribacillus asahii]|uniref:Uncharacterized protein n=1 Tax=Peribacillus asahii TaxID=228899 RepID=A0A3Q9RNZ3_9BACI|nr:hypothetical protein BAOM_2932 [Peribacillus asahii]